MIHDFATLPRQVKEADIKQVPVAPSRSRFRLGWPLLLVLVAGFAFIVRMNSNDGLVEFSPGEAEALEYLASGMQQSSFDDQNQSETQHRETESDEAVENVVSAVEVDAVAKVAEQAPELKEQVSTPAHEEQEYVFYESLSSSHWQVPVQKGVYFTEEDKIKAQAQYILQAASLKSRAEAERLVSKLRKLNMNASFNESQSAYGGVWFRVMVGPFKNHSRMNKAEDILASMHIKPLKRRFSH